MQHTHTLHKKREEEKREGRGKKDLFPSSSSSFALSRLKKGTPLPFPPLNWVPFGESPLPPPPPPPPFLPIKTEAEGGSRKQLPLLLLLFFPLEEEESEPFLSRVAEEAEAGGGTRRQRPHSVASAASLPQPQPQPAVGRSLSLRREVAEGWDLPKCLRKNTVATKKWIFFVPPKNPPGCLSFWANPLPRRRRSRVANVSDGRGTMSSFSFLPPSLSTAQHGKGGRSYRKRRLGNWNTLAVALCQYSASPAKRRV